MANLFTNPENFAAVWSGNLNVDANVAVAPDGTTTADRGKDDASNTGAKKFIVFQQVTVLTDTTYYCSAFVKRDTLDWFFIELDTFTSVPLDAQAYFDINNGVVGAPQSWMTSSPNFVDTGIEEYADGWFRPWVSFVSDSVDTQGFPRFGLSSADDADTAPSDDTSKTLIWGADMDVGSSPQPYTSEAGITVTGLAFARAGMGLSFGKMGGMGHG